MADVREPGASGTLEARYISHETAKSKAGKSWAKVKITIDGVSVQARAYGDELIGTLEGFSKQEPFTFWGVLDSSTSDQGMVFTNLKIAKIYEDGNRNGGSQVYVLGKITEIGEVIGKKDGKVMGKFMDLDTTSNPAYPSKVRLQFAFGTGPGDLKVGEVIEIDAFMNKYGIWVVEGPEQKQTGRAVPEGTRSFRRPAPPKEAKGTSSDETEESKAPATEDPGIDW